LDKSLLHDVGLDVIIRLRRIRHVMATIINTIVVTMTLAVTMTTAGTEKTDEDRGCLFFLQM